MKALVDSAGKVMVGSDGKVATDDCPGTCCAAPGACCFGTDCAIYPDETSCTADGGTYQGDGTVCDPNPCVTILLLCDQISASKSKCGFSSECTVFSTSGNVNGPCGTEAAIGDKLAGSDCGDTAIYLTRTTVDAGCDNTGLTTTECPNQPGYYLGPSTGTLTVIETTDPSDCSTDSETTGEIDTPYCLRCDGSALAFDDCGDCASGTFMNNRLAIGFACVTEDISYTDEYTTDDLIANTIATLPAYDDNFADSCLASRDLSFDETSYSISRFRYKFTFDPADHDRTLNWTDENGAPASELIPTDATESSVYSVNEPGSNGLLTIDVGTAFFS